jgi:hypothetical protein
LTESPGETLLLCTVAVALVGTVVTLVAPKAVHAGVAALVQVVNTSTNPVPNADVNAPGEEPFHAFLCVASGPVTGVCAATVSTGSFTVPTTTPDGLSVKRLVIEHVYFDCAVSAKNFGATWLQGSGPRIILPITGVSPTNEKLFTSLPVRSYENPGSVVGAFVATTPPSSYDCGYDVVGSLITH